jgi:radical SAM protein with 4Fe4S-binding SPASM domain
VTTQVNRQSLPTLVELAPDLQAAGALGWQLQLTLPMGRAARAGGLVLGPDEMPRVLDVVRVLAARRGLRPQLTDNLGYFTRDDPVLRTPQGGRPRIWLGCFAGLRHVGITSDGRVKGCLALPDTLVEGHLGERTLADLWNDPSRFSLNRRPQQHRRAGGCAECSLSDLCGGGCPAVALAFHGRTGMSLHCWHLHDKEWRLHDDPIASQHAPTLGSGCRFA